MIRLDETILVEYQKKWPTLFAFILGNIHLRTKRPDIGLCVGGRALFMSMAQLAARFLPSSVECVESEINIFLFKKKKNLIFSTALNAHRHRPGPPLGPVETENFGGKKKWEIHFQNGRNVWMKKVVWTCFNCVGCCSGGSLIELGVLHHRLVEASTWIIAITPISTSSSSRRPHHVDQDEFRCVHLLSFLTLFFCFCSCQTLHDPSDEPVDTPYQ